MRAITSRLTPASGVGVGGTTVSIKAPSSEAACDAAHFLLPLPSERENEHVAHEGLVLAEAHGLAAALLRDLREGIAHGLVEVRQRRDLLQLLPVEPAVQLALVLFV